MVELTPKEFKANLQRTLATVSGNDLKNASKREIYLALGALMKETIGENWAQRKHKYKTKGVKQAYYLSMEYLTGKFTETNIRYLGLFEVVKKGLEDLGYSLEEIILEEQEPGLGNGGLGRLAAAFLDSLSCLNLPGHGYGLRYEKGLFKQKIKSKQQMELPDNWLKDKNIWEYKKEDIHYEIKLGGAVDIDKKGDKLIFNHVNYHSVKAQAYDIPILGYLNDSVNTLRLWSAESYGDVDFNEFAKGNLQGAFHDIINAKKITQFLYPNDSNWEGKKLRLTQEYFLVSASIQDIIRKYKQLNRPMKDIYQYVSIHLNDTHPVLAIPEFMRILLDEEQFEWEEAWKITGKTFAFTNHTIMSEAMETWNINLYKEVLPRIYLITDEIHQRFLHNLKYEKKIESSEELEKLAIIHNEGIRMLNLAIAGSYSINGVAKLHTDILKEKELRHFYNVYPEKFNNKTNGIVHRRWLLSANSGLTNLLEDKIGKGFEKDPIKLKKFLAFRKDKNTLETLDKIKHKNKEELAKIIYKEQGILLNPYSIFDIQIKRIHEYKRQLMNILHVIYLYDSLKENANLDIAPRTFFFAGKAAPGYYIAKEIIRLINAVAELVNNDIYIKDKLKVVFVDNYNVSKAMKLIPAADVSEQISTTTKEASGTGNMKFMMNGAITLATLDGANVEIAKEVGEENIIIFGLKDYEVYQYYNSGSYNSREIYEKNKGIKKTVDRLIDNNYFKGDKNFRELYDSLVTYNDNYFILKDFEDYKKAQEQIGTLYRNKEKWFGMSVVNIAKSGTFSSDHTIKKYAQEIWDIKPI